MKFLSQWKIIQDWDELETLRAIEKVVKAWETLGKKENLLPDVAMRVIEIINNVEVCMIDINKFLNKNSDVFKFPYKRCSEDYIYASDGSILIKTISKNYKFSTDISLLDNAEKINAFEKLFDFQDYKPLPFLTITDALNNIKPVKEIVYKQYCSECKGDGMVTCTCLNCDNEHERECKKCEGEGSGEGSIEEIYKTTLVSIEGLVNEIVSIDYKYLKLIIDIVNSFDGEWESGGTTALSPVYFRNKDKEINIVVMPMRK